MGVGSSRVTQGGLTREALRQRTRHDENPPKKLAQADRRNELDAALVDADTSPSNYGDT